MGGWAVAQSPILKTTITEKHLKRRGYEQILYSIHLVLGIFSMICIAKKMVIIV